MDESRNLPANTSKDLLLHQMKRCRDRVQLVTSLRDNVVNAVDEAVIAVTAIITAVEQAVETADAAEIKLLSKDVRNASNMVRRYEDALEGIMDVAEMDDNDDRMTLATSVELDRSSAARESTLSTNQAAPATSGACRQLPSPLPGRLSSAAAVGEANLLDLSDSVLPPLSPDFNTAESCAASSFADSASVDQAGLLSAPLVAAANLIPVSTAAVEQCSVGTQSASPPPIIARIPSGQIEATAAALGQLALSTRTSPVPTDVFEALTNQEAPVQTDRNDIVTSLSDGLGSTSTSRSENLTSTESASSGDDVFMEGGSIPAASFSFEADNSVRFYMRHIVSPDEFYVQPLSHEASAMFSQLRRDLSQFYDDDDNRKQLFQDGDGESAAGKVGRYGVYCRRDFHSSDLDIERCEVIELRKATATGRARALQRYEAQIRFVDVGVKQWVPAAHIWKIDQRFCQVPALTIRCRLFDTRPRDEGSTSGFGVWNEEAISKFKALCDGDRPMTGFVGNKSSLVIFTSRDSEKICVNAKLVSQKYAKTLTNWNKVSMISTGDERNRIQTRDQTAMNLSVDFLCFGPEIPLLPPPSANTVVLVEVQKWFNSCRFSVNFPDGVGDYLLMQQDPQYKAVCREPIRKFETALRQLNEMYKRDDAFAFAQWPLVGQLVASKFGVDEQYYRARLLDVVPQAPAPAHVRYVDYGNDEWVSMQSLRSLTPEFLALPYMATECCLAGLRSLPGLSTSNNLNELQEFVSRLELGKGLLARVVRVLKRTRPAGPVLSVVLMSKDRMVNINEFVLEKQWAERDDAGA